MDDEYEVVQSPLNQKVTKDGMTIEVCIYRGKGEDAWVLEVVDEDGGSTVWEDRFPTDVAAWDEVMSTIADEGIAVFLHGGKDHLH